jgi:hypothetical protein
MPHHFPKNTVEASIWCNTCNRVTPWRVLNGKRGYCIPCYDAKATKPERVEKPFEQQIRFVFERGAMMPCEWLKTAARERSAEKTPRLAAVYNALTTQSTYVHRGEAAVQSGQIVIRGSK